MKKCRDEQDEALRKFTEYARWISSFKTLRERFGTERSKLAVTAKLPRSQNRKRKRMEECRIMEEQKHKKSWIQEYERQVNNQRYSFSQLTKLSTST